MLAMLHLYSREKSVTVVMILFRVTQWPALPQMAATAKGKGPDAPTIRAAVG